MKKIFIYASILSFVLTSCYNDKGNYNYKEIGEIKVDINNGDPIEGAPGLPFSIEPKITTELDESNFSYIWVIELDTVSYEKILTIEALQLVPRTALYPAKLEINDGSTDYSYQARFEISVSTAGFIILSEAESGSSQISVISDNEVNGEKVFTNVFEKVNGRKLGGDPKGLVIGSQTFPDGGFLHILVGEGAHGAMVNAGSLGEYKSTNDAFLNGIYPSTGMPNGQINFDNFYSNTIMLWGNQLYKGSDPDRSGVQTYLQSPALPDNEFDYVNHCGSFRIQYLYEKNEQSYYYESWGGVYPVELPEFLNTGNEFINGSNYSTGAFDGIVIDIVKGSDGKIHEFKFLQGYFGPETLVSNYEFPTAYTIDETTPFVLAGTDHYYFTEGNKLYRRNHVSETEAVKLIWESTTGDITDVFVLDLDNTYNSPYHEVLKGNGLVISTYDGSGPLSGDVYVVDDAITSFTVIDKFENIAGKIKSVIYR